MVLHHAGLRLGHTLQQGFEANLKKYGGTEVGASLTPLGTTDFSSYLIKAEAAKPDVIIDLTAGQDAGQFAQADRPVWS